MDGKLYDLMNWPRIEALVYSEEDEPQEILGPHKVAGGILIQAFLPTAMKVTVAVIHVIVCLPIVVSAYFFSFLKNIGWNPLIKVSISDNIT